MSYKRQNDQAWSCDRCGALVDNTSLHDKWHLMHGVTANPRPTDKKK